MSVDKSKVKVISASVKGPAHEHKGLECQDCHSFAFGKNFVAIVSDGAGSAKHGRIGAKNICETLSDALKNASMKNIKSCVEKAIESARDKLLFHRLNPSKSEKDLHLFAATVVGAVCSGNKGVFFHIGDGAGIALNDQNYQQFVASFPQNGNFSCETFFYTMENWKENLRFTKFDNANTLFLMSDGVTGFSFSPDFCQLEPAFVEPINNFLQKEKNKTKATAALNNTLNNVQAKKINSDDKTLLWARIEK